MSHIRRLSLAAIFAFGAFILGMIIDTVVVELFNVAHDFGASEGPFGSVIPHLEGVSQFVVPMLLLGISLWVVYGTIQEERREEVRRRVQP